MGSRIECRVCREAAAKAAANAGRGGEIRGDVGRYGEMWGGMGEAPVGRMLRLLLSDGGQRVVALEYSRLRDLSTLTPIGDSLINIILID